MLVGDVSFTQNLHLGAVMIEVMDWLEVGFCFNAV